MLRLGRFARRSLLRSPLPWACVETRRPLSSSSSTGGDNSDTKALIERLKRELEEAKREKEEMMRETEEIKRETEEITRETVEEIERKAAKATEEAERELEEMMRRTEEIKRETEEIKRKTEEIIRKTARTIRLKDLQHVEPASIRALVDAPKTASSRTFGIDMLESVDILEAAPGTLEALLPPAPPAVEVVEGRIYAEVLAELCSGDRPRAQEHTEEVSSWQPLVSTLIALVGRSAARHGCGVLRAHHSERATDGATRLDICFTPPNERRIHHSSMCWLMEVKPLSRVSHDVASLSREAAAQCLRTLALRQVDCDDVPGVGLAMVVVGWDAAIIRVDFDQPSIPVRCSKLTRLFPPAAFGQAEDWEGMLSRLPSAPAGAGAAPAGSGAASASGGAELLGLRALIRLMLVQDLGAFGLARVLAAPPPGGPYEDSGELLGEGGYGNVAKWVAVATGELVAAKYPRRHRPEAATDFAREAGVLDALEEAGVPRVPRLALPRRGGDGAASRLTAAADGRPVLLQRPVGVPVRRHMRGLPLDARLSAAAAMGLALWETLACAHAAGYLHGDVRPGNVVLAGDTPAWVLIDWGLAERHPAGERAVGLMRGEPAFLSGPRLRALCKGKAATWIPTPEDDLQAAAMTFMAAAGDADCGASIIYGTAFAPWVGSERREWILRRWPCIEAAAAMLPHGCGLRDAVAAYHSAAVADTLEEGSVGGSKG